MTARVLEAPVESPELFKGAGGMSPSPERLEGYKRILAAFLWRSHRTVSIAIARQPLMVCLYIKDAYMIKQNRLKVV